MYWVCVNTGNKEGNETSEEGKQASAHTMGLVQEPSTGEIVYKL
jgi:hypothetical protein